MLERSAGSMDGGGGNKLGPFGNVGAGLSLRDSQLCIPLRNATAKRPHRKSNRDSTTKGSHNVMLWLQCGAHSAWGAMFVYAGRDIL